MCSDQCWCCENTQWEHKTGTGEKRLRGKTGTIGPGESQHGMNVPNIEKGMCADQEEGVLNPRSRNFSIVEEQD